MGTIDLIHCVPERLAEEADLNELLETVKSLQDWQERHAEVLDYIYRQRLIRLLVGRLAVDEVSALNEHFERILHPRRLEAMQQLGRLYGARWAAYKDILESRIASLRSRGPQKILEMTHVQQIVDLVLSGRATKQAEIRQALRLRPANLTRVLNAMEANDLIERRTEGREKTIHPGPMLQSAQPESAQAAAEIPRGAQFIRRQAAA